ncbi:MAG: hypothetical protein IPG99_09545 [Ignavibacteria bacterium]|nr:hypothetical protein [Ignavibacteria bacterium]
MVIDKTTHYYRTENLWAVAEYYLYGKITNAGRKRKRTYTYSPKTLGL